MMNVVLLRVGIDTGSGGIHGPLFADGSFAYVPIPDTYGVSEYTYGNMRDRFDKPLSDYFPKSRQRSAADQPVHLDPEFETFTYGDPSRTKRSLGKLQPGDMLVFYCGLEGWEDYDVPSALYLMGYFEVELAILPADEADQSLIEQHFANNFHVHHPSAYQRDKDRLVLVKGGPGSRLLAKAVKISKVGQDSAGQSLKVLSDEMRDVFGDFTGINSLQRSTPRWVSEDFVERAADFVRSCE
jgi:hypothetical protein